MQEMPRAITIGDSVIFTDKIISVDLEYTSLTGKKGGVCVYLPAGGPVESYYVFHNKHADKLREFFRGLSYLVSE